MRIAILATSYPSSAGDPSGHFVRAEALDLARQGHEVHVLAPAPHEEPGLIAHPCGGVRLLSWPGAVARFRQNPARLAALGPFAVRALRALRAVRPDRVHAHWAVPCGWPIALLAAPASSLELTLHGADVRLLLASPPLLRRRMLRALLGARRVRFVATELKERLLASLPELEASRLAQLAVVEPPRVNVDFLRSPPGRPFMRYAVTMGRLVKSKRTGLALEAVARTSGLGLVVIGDGPERAVLERQAQEELPGRVVFTGLLGRPEALGYLAQASVLLHPSAEEGAPTAVLEALALDVPVLCCGAGDTGRWAANRSRLVVEEPDAERMATKLRGLVEEKKRANR